MLTNNNDISAKIDDEIQKANKENSLLKSQLSDLSSNIAPNQFQIGDKASYRVGVSRYDRTIETNLNFDKFLNTIKTQFPQEPKNIAFEVDDRKIWIRNDADVQNMFKQHFAKKAEALKIIEAKNGDFNDISALKLPKEEPSASIYIYFGLPKCDYWIFLPISNSITSKEDAIQYFSQINPKQKAVKLIDSDGDQIALNDDVTWEYFLNDAKNSTLTGRFCSVISE